MNIIHLDPSQIIPDLDTLDLQTGRRPKPNPRMDAIKYAVITEAAGLLDPVAIWTRIEPEHIPEIPGMPARSISGIQSMIGAVCTIGARLEKRTHQYFEEQDNLKAYYLDQIGTLAVSKLAQTVGADLRGQYGALYWAPGDDRGDMELASQRFLFGMVPADQIGIQLNDNNIMIPIKSLSFFLVIGEKVSGLRCAKPCAQCAWNGKCDKRLQLVL